MKSIMGLASIALLVSCKGEAPKDTAPAPKPVAVAVTPKAEPAPAPPPEKFEPFACPGPPSSCADVRLPGTVAAAAPKPAAAPAATVKGPPPSKAPKATAKKGG